MQQVDRGGASKTKKGLLMSERTSVAGIVGIAAAAAAAVVAG